MSLDQEFLISTQSYKVVMENSRSGTKFFPTLYLVLLDKISTPFLIQKGTKDYRSVSFLITITLSFVKNGIFFFDPLRL